MIPQDVQYADIDHMSARRDFTLDNDTFQGLPQYFQQLRDGGMRTIIILVRAPAFRILAHPIYPNSRLNEGIDIQYFVHNGMRTISILVRAPALPALPPPTPPLAVVNLV